MQRNYLLYVFFYHAQRRLSIKILLIARVDFIVTKLRWKSSNVVKFYNKPSTAEQWIKEGKYALNWTRPILP